MNPNEPNREAASATPAAPSEPHTGAGADTAFEAMLKNRAMRPGHVIDSPARDRLPCKPAE